MKLDPSRSPLAQPIALVSDIHGQREALEAVLEELKRRDVSMVIAAGDHLTTGPDPLGVWRRLSEIKARLARGLSDSALVSIGPDKLKPKNAEEEASVERFLRVRAAVGDLVLEELRRLPLTVRVPLIDGSELVVAHGTPNDPFEEITQDLSDEEIFALVADDPADFIACGASHVPFQRVIEGVHVINVGSVGAAPEGRIAHFTILTPVPGATRVEQNWLEY